MFRMKLFHLFSVTSFHMKNILFAVSRLGVLRFATVSEQGNLSATHGCGGTHTKTPCKLFLRKTFGVSCLNAWLLCRGLFVCFLLLLLQFGHFRWLFAVRLGLREVI